jgi:hypothetical protein
LKKWLFHLILKNSDLNLEDLETQYHNIKKIRPFSEEERKFIFQSEIANDIIKLEVFFFNYIQSERIIEKITDSKPKYLEIGIPLNPIAYNFEIYEPIVRENVIQILKDNKKRAIESFKRILKNESVRRIKKEFKEIRVFYEYSDIKATINKLKEEKIYYNSIETLNKEKGEIFFKDPIAQPFIILRGRFNTNFNYKKITKHLFFQIADESGLHLDCKYLGDKTDINKINNRALVEIQGFLKIDIGENNEEDQIFIKNRILEVIGIKILENFETLKAIIKKEFNGIYTIENSSEGLTLYRRQEKKDDFYYEPIFSKPVFLHAFSKTNNYIFYDVEIGEYRAFLPLDRLVAEIKNKTDYYYTAPPDKVVYYLNILFRKWKEDYKLVETPMYATVGVFLDENNDLIIASVENKDMMVVGENQLQRELIEQITIKGIDHQCELIETYFKIHLLKYPDKIRKIVYMGYGAINPFFFALRDKLRIFPNFFAVGLPATCKTTQVEIFHSILYGTSLRTKDDIGSNPRYTKFETESTFALFVDEIDGVTEDFVNHVKASSTRKTKRVRLRPDQTALSEQEYASYIGTANKIEFLLEDLAFRNRSIILFHDDIPNFTAEEEQQFEELYDEINNGKVLGFQLLENALGFIDQAFEGESSIYKKFCLKIDIVRAKIKKKLDKKQIRISDSRRYKVFTLIYIGLEIWDYFFNKHGLKSPILAEALDLNQDLFFEMVKEVQSAEVRLGMEEFAPILSFFESYKIKNPMSENAQGDLVLKRDFIDKYDEWSTKRHYKQLNSLKNLSIIQNRILGINEPVDRTHIITKNIDGETIESGTEHNLKFHYNELYKIRHGQYPKSIKKKKITLDQNFRKEQEFYDHFQDKVYEIFEDNKFQELEINSLIQVLKTDFKERLVLTYLEKLSGEGKISDKSGKIRWIQ